MVVLWGVLTYTLWRALYLEIKEKGFFINFCNYAGYKMYNELRIINFFKCYSSDLGITGNT